MPTDYEIITKIVLDTDQAIKNLKSLNAELAKKKKDFRAVGDQSKETSAVIAGETKKSSKAVKDSTKAVKDKQKAWDDLGKTLRRVALVAFAAIGLALRKVIGWMEEASKANIEFQRTMYLFEVSIRALQRTGFDTTIAEWRAEIERFKKQFPIFSQQEIVSAITNATLKMREYEFTMEEINNILELSAVLARATGKDFGELATQITGALTRGYFEALQNLGFPIGRITVMQEAYNKGLEESFTMLSEAERAHLGYQIVMRHSTAITEDLGAVTTQVFDRMRIAEADITDATMELGGVWVYIVVRIKETWASLLELLLEPIVIPNPFKGLAEQFQSWLTQMSVGFGEMAKIAELLPQLQVFGKSLGWIGDEFELLADQMGAVNDEIVFWRGDDVETFWQKAELALIEYGKGLEEVLTTIQQLEEEDVRSIEEQERLDEAYRRLIKYKTELENLTGLEIPIVVEEGMTLDDISETIAKIKKLFIDAEGGLVLHPDLQLLLDTGQIEAALAWLENVIGETMGDITDATEAASDEMAKEMERAAKEMGEALSDIDVWFTIKVREAGIDLASDLAKMARDLAQDLAKIQRDLSASIAKANADAKAQIAEKNRDYRNDELKEEEEYLRKMKYLREDFLMDLEEALRERDAKQIIRLTREYHVDARRMTEDYEAGKKDRANAHKDEIADITSQNNRKVAELKAQAKREAEERKRAADIAVEERKIRYQEEMDALDRQLQDKLEALAQEFADEYDLTADWLREFSKLLAHQYDKGSALYNYGIAIAQTIGLIYQLQQAQAGLGFGGRYSGDIYDPAQRYAEGGVLLATKPTIAVFGEAGPELVHFTPLADISATPNLSRTITDAGIQQGATITHEGGMSVQEQLGLEIWLQEGLEGRIIGRALDETTSVFDAVLRKR